MDISKIRKKAKEREQQPEVERPTPVSPGAEDTGTAEEAPGEAPPADDMPEERQPEEPSAEAKTAETRDKEEGILELLTFRLSHEECAFRVAEVEEIIRYQKITKAPTVPGYVLGITSLRGKIIPVVDLKTRLALSDSAEPAEGVEREGSSSKEKILIMAGPKGLIGALVDRVMGVVRMSSGSVLDPPSHLTEDERRFIEGVVIMEKRFITIVRAEEALNIELG